MAVGFNFEAWRLLEGHGACRRTIAQLSAGFDSLDSVGAAATAGERGDVVLDVVGMAELEEDCDLLADLERTARPQPLGSVRELLARFEVTACVFVGERAVRAQRQAEFLETLSRGRFRLFQVHEAQQTAATACLGCRGLGEAGFGLILSEEQ